MSDYISREAAIKAVQEEFACETCNGGNIGTTCMFCNVGNAIRHIKNVPAADVAEVRHGRWIPCSERPPEELEPVNVVWVNHRPEPYYGKIKDVPQKATAVYYRGKWYWWSCVCEDFLAEYGRNEPDLVDSDIEITHWMPLPEPPKEEQNETD